jgi:anaerobic selenocysteine-containing dehydrogenase
MTTKREVVTYCRVCPATCGIVATIEQADAREIITKVVGDEANPLSRGFTCTKGRHIADIVQAPNRLRSCQRRGPDGATVSISPEQAIAEIASSLQELIAAHGPDSVAMFTGTAASMSSLTLPAALAFWRTIGSRNKYSTMSVDQVAKWVSEGRLGQWAAGGQRFGEADVWMFFGTNPLVSMQGGYFTGYPVHDGVRRLQAEVNRGLRLIVVDPRRTETAAQAEIHLQIVPGTDATLAAGLLRQLLSDGLVDAAFVSRWVSGADSLTAAVAPFSPDVVAEVCGVAAEDVVRAARVFGEANSGMATGGTGPDMGPFANLAEHLVQTLNVVCGRFPQPGDALAHSAVLGAARGLPAQVVEPRREWESTTSDVSGFGQLHGEYPAVTLPDEILSDRPDRIRALLVIGANPANTVPDSARMAEALSSLDLLVTIDPFESDTAALADYVVAPVMHLERPDTTRAYEGLMDRPFAQYTPAVITAPDGTIDDWEFLLRLGQTMGSTIRIAGREYGPSDPVPSTDDVLGSFSERGQVGLGTVRAHPHGALFDEVEPPRALPPDPDASGRFEVAAPDVEAELDDLGKVQEPWPDGQLVLAVRRHKNTLNSTGPQIPALVDPTGNHAHLHPADLERLGLYEGDAAMIATRHGSIDVLVASDPSLRRGVVNVAHGFGGVGADGSRVGRNVNDLLSATVELQSISAMPLLTGVPVTVSGKF